MTFFAYSTTQVWEEMKQSGIKPDLRAFNELLKICTDGESHDREIAFQGTSCNIFSIYL